MLTPQATGELGYALVAVLSAGLALLLLISWRGRMQGMLLVVAVTINAVWATALAVQVTWKILPIEVIWVLESLRAFAWILFLARLLEFQIQERPGALRLLKRLRGVAVAIALLLSLPFESWVSPFVGEAYEIALQARMFGYVALSVIGLVLVEHVYRNTLWQRRNEIRFLCFGLGALFGFDFYFYADAMLVNRIDPEILLVRGPWNVVVIPLLAISAARNPRWTVHLFVSRTLVFHTTALVATGIYLVLMAFAGYWIKIHGEEWSGPLQLLFLIGAGGVPLLLFFSGHLRAWLKVFIAKSFFRSRFDYRHEWIRVTRRLSGQELHVGLPERIVITLGELVDRPGGAIWVSDGKGRFRWESCVGCSEVWIDPSWDAGEFCLSLERIGWILDLAEYARDPSLYPGLDVPPWMGDLRNFSLAVPILHEHRVLGFVLLVKPLVPHPLNWETIDLLKTAAMQAGSYLALEQTAKALAEAHQFDGFNRLSAFVVHDLKNLVAQLTLVVRNAERHKNNPAFVEDAFATVGSAVEKMNRLLLQLRGAGSGERADSVDLRRLLRDLVAESGRREPVPVLDVNGVEHGVVHADLDRLTAVIDNVIRNAQEATDRSGQVRVSLVERGGEAVIEVADTGVGMDEDFIRNRLFRPFESTKGLAGMGIGAYDCRQYILGIGGNVEVTSRPGEGACFRIHIPLASDIKKAETGSVPAMET
ncbi:XrtA/PEP-CTERM system histidine kinase PrsK [Thiocapsa bogorovii]|uniref:XrtA/PEP-CTERM system histidine kinase PrsK n=1 Tax=Thiocapsa bogorovii TaxID=521689 RepID=UPI001E33280F|nr:XrtA/PEP-CTERM system histidine kinase PrsK [Thiocapsa bogorovii]UHD16222.1 PEP-CTERM system histidine kinase PrsK [Thiocapsa bogorovii]